MIVKQGKHWVLKSKTTGKTLGKHKSKASAVRQEKAIKAAQAARGKK